MYRYQSEFSGRTSIVSISNSRLDVYAQLKVVAKLRPTDFENAVPLAEMESLQRHLIHQFQEIELGEFEQIFPFSRMAVALAIIRRLDAHWPGFQDVRIRVIVVIDESLGTVQTPATSDRAHDHRQHVVQSIADSRVVGLGWDFGHFGSLSFTGQNNRVPGRIQPSKAARRNSRVAHPNAAGYAARGEKSAKNGHAGSRAHSMQLPGVTDTRQPRFATFSAGF